MQITHASFPLVALESVQSPLGMISEDERRTPIHVVRATVVVPQHPDPLEIEVWESKSMLKPSAPPMLRIRAWSPSSPTTITREECDAVSFAFRRSPEGVAIMKMLHCLESVRRAEAEAIKHLSRAATAAQTQIEALKGLTDAMTTESLAGSPVLAHALRTSPYLATRFAAARMTEAPTPTPTPTPASRVASPGR